VFQCSISSVRVLSDFVCLQCRIAGRMAWLGLIRPKLVTELKVVNRGGMALKPKSKTKKPLKP